MGEIDHARADRSARLLLAHAAILCAWHGHRTWLSDCIEDVANAYLALLTDAGCADPRTVLGYEAGLGDAASLRHQLRLAQEDVIRLTEERNRQRGRIAAMEAVNEALLKGLGDAGERGLRHG
jgi:hypothetical protein